MTRIFFLRLLIPAGACAGLLMAQESISGTWTYRMDTPNGEVTAELILKVEGEKLTGKFTFEGNRVLNIENGTAKNNELKFTVKRDRESGGTMVYEMTGKVEGNKITGRATTTMDGSPAEMGWSASR
jgi:hypothetical protein